MSVCLSVCLPQRICSFFLPPLFSGNVGSNPPASRSTPLCTHSLLSWVLQPNKLFSRRMGSYPPQEESKHSWKRRQRRAYRHYLQSWGQSFRNEISKPLPACSSSYHPLCISACTEWRTRHFPVLCIPTACSSCTSPAPPSHSFRLAIPPRMVASWEGKEHGAPLKAALPMRIPLSLFAAGSYRQCSALPAQLSAFS